MWARMMIRVTMIESDLFGYVQPPVEPTEYIVYHDESKEPGFWHIFLFVPVASRAELIAAPEEAWRNSRFKGQHRHYSDLRSSATGHNMADYWLRILQKLAERFRDYCRLHRDCGIDGENVSPQDRIILDAADILLGVVRNCITSAFSDLNPRKAAHCRMVQPLLDVIGEGQKRMINSRLGIFGSLSNARLENGQWIFAPLSPMINDARISSHPRLPM